MAVDSMHVTRCRAPEAQAPASVRVSSIVGLRKLSGALACGVVALVLQTEARAQVPSVLIEACSMLEPASKRIECLQQANQGARSSNGASPSQGYRPPAPSAPSYLQSAPAPNTSYAAPSGQTCFVGPRGGTYTITKSGKKNYGGC